MKSYIDRRIDNSIDHAQEKTKYFKNQWHIPKFFPRLGGRMFKVFSG